MREIKSIPSHTQIKLHAVHRRRRQVELREEKKIVCDFWESQSLLTETTIYKNHLYDH